MLDGPSRPCVPPVWVCFCDSVAPEGPFTTSTALLAPFQSWWFFCFLPLLALRCYLRCKIGAATIQPDGERQGTQINCFFFLSPLHRLRSCRQPRIYAEKSRSSSWTLDWNIFVCLSMFSLVLPRTFSHSCASASVTLYAWRAQGYFYSI